MSRCIVMIANTSMNIVTTNPQWFWSGCLCGINMSCGSSWLGSVWWAPAQAQAGTCHLAPVHNKASLQKLILGMGPLRRVAQFFCRWNPIFCRWKVLHELCANVVPACPILFVVVFVVFFTAKIYI